jgi:hypothetical protein
MRLEINWNITAKLCWIAVAPVDEDKFEGYSVAQSIRDS